MTAKQFPQFIQNLPQADLPVSGIRGWLFNGEKGQLLFIRAEQKTLLPEHKHGDQWGIVVAGRMELTIGTSTGTYRQGDSYFIPAGTLHKATLEQGFLALDYFADRDRYHTK